MSISLDDGDFLWQPVVGFQFQFQSKFDQPRLVPLRHSLFATRVELDLIPAIHPPMPG